MDRLVAQAERVGGVMDWLIPPPPPWGKPKFSKPLFRHIPSKKEIGMTVNLQKHIDLLGMRVVDRVTGSKGVVTSIGFDLYGCVQAIVNPGQDKDGKPMDSVWYDVARLEVTSNKPVMPRPSFEWTPEVVAAGRKGPAEKPAFHKA